MNFSDIFNYFINGYQLLSDQLRLSIVHFTSALDLINVLDIVLVIIMLWWLWIKIRRTSLIKIVPLLIWLLLIILFSKLFAFSTLFYIALILLLTILITAVLLYTQEIQTILENTLNKDKTKSIVRPLGHYELTNFIRDLTDTVAVLAKSKTPSLIVVRTSKPMIGLIENGTPLKTPFSKDFVLDLFSRKSKLSSGAIIVDNSIITAVGSTLTLSSPKSFPFTLENPVLKQTALHWEALVIITHKNAETISLLHKDQVYSKLALNNLERVLKNIITSR